mmetsp:Transcript_52693/g.155283  ORF Transcript_52693/g.155283 Transcript_52693/m.155283 type:complete len:572 (-) Transcript_52693:78-1793(-)
MHPHTCQLLFSCRPVPTSRDVVDDVELVRPLVDGGVHQDRAVRELLHLGAAAERRSHADVARRRDDVVQVDLRAAVLEVVATELGARLGIVVVDEVGAVPLRPLCAWVQERAVVLPVATARPLPDPLQLRDPVLPRPRVHLAHLRVRDEDERKVVRRDGLVGLDELRDVLLQGPDVRGVQGRHGCDLVRGDVLVARHRVVQRLPRRRRGLAVIVSLCSHHVLQAVDPRHVVVVGHAPDDCLVRPQVRRQVVTRVVLQGLPAHGRADARYPNESIGMPELILRARLLQVRPRRGVVVMLGEGVGPLPEVEGPAELHRLGQRARGLPLPCNGRGHDHKVGLVELPDVPRQVQRPGPVAVRVVRLEPLEREVEAREDGKDQARLVTAPIDDLAVDLDDGIPRRVLSGPSHVEVDPVLRRAQDGVAGLHVAPLAARVLHLLGPAGTHAELHRMRRAQWNPVRVGAACPDVGDVPRRPRGVARPVRVLLVQLPVPEPLEVREQQRVPVRSPHLQLVAVNGAPRIPRRRPCHQDVHVRGAQGVPRLQERTLPTVPAADDREVVRPHEWWSCEQQQQR